MRCVYCDTAYAFHGGERREIAAILADVAEYKPRFVTVTGGEPLAQKECLTLLSALCDTAYEVSIETGGGVDISGVDERVCVVMDIKTPGSGEEGANLYRNLEHLKSTDLVKFVLCNEDDYLWARDKISELRLARFEILLSPVWQALEPGQLADWVLRDRLPVRVQVQLHKMLWGDVPGR
jgi:7-carboxy-7-deazaguanine synthase